ncbi:putative membrane protein [Paraburkholderia sp. UCT70]|uniref:cytochrome b561 domain-containing protein n=1 Tax=Paraburkholderia sp. UCT70 TaxID=2991068 RepID=UPI003D1A709F
MSAEEFSLVTWLMAPLSGAGEHHLPMWAAWHGRGMVLAWGILIPLGVLIARYFKITPRQVWPEELDNKFWWRWHRRLQYVGTFIAVCALVIVIQYARQATAIAHIHGLLGWATMLLAATQIASGVLRGTKGGPTGELAAEGSYRGDHYDMTRRRIVFEYVHKFGGVLALLIAGSAIVIGLFVADAPRWMLIIILLWWCLLGVAAGALQMSGRCIDTYQAIWGPDPLHPGNKIKVIGIGVRRVGAKDNPHH